MIHPDSYLFITLDSCRYDTFEKAHAPNMKGLGQFRKAFTIANFTYPAHQAFFMGFLPGDKSGEKYWDSRRARIFHLHSATSTKQAEAYIVLKGMNIKHGFQQKGYTTIGTGAMGWFNPEMDSSKPLTSHFNKYKYTGTDLNSQLTFVQNAIDSSNGPLFVFMNIGETHTPYTFEGCPWDGTNYCLPFSNMNNRAECEKRQKGCVEFIDKKLGPLLNRFKDASTVLCGDHGDSWGEQGIWEHSVTCAPVMQVPMTMRLRKK